MARKTPIGTIKADLENSEGFAVLSKDFLKLAPLARADILKDIGRELQRAYSQALDDLQAANGKVL